MFLFLQDVLVNPTACLRLGSPGAISKGLAMVKLALGVGKEQVVLAQVLPQPRVMSPASASVFSGS